MPRKGHIQKRDVLADPLYNNKAEIYQACQQASRTLSMEEGCSPEDWYGAFAKVEEERQSLLWSFWRGYEQDHALLWK